jgi:D-beta-D-heptose 7-phosphate kinase/D-beta-D-heptose 1-phosphate adenosyltransferase
MKVFVNGTFDILHPGHLALLNYAKTLGDFLLVAIDADSRVKQLKGTTRPINNEHDRKLLLENLKAVDEVCVFNSDEELLHLISQCDIMVKGSDYKDKPVIGSNLIKIAYYERTAHSTTKTIQDITNR